MYGAPFPVISCWEFPPKVFNYVICFLTSDMISVIHFQDTITNFYKQIYDYKNTVAADEFDTEMTSLEPCKPSISTQLQ